MTKEWVTIATALRGIACCTAGVPPATGHLAGGTPALRTAFCCHIAGLPTHEEAYVYGMGLRSQETVIGLCTVPREFYNHSMEIFERTYLW